MDQTLDMKEHFYVEEKTEETDRIMRAIGKKITYQVISSAPAARSMSKLRRKISGLSFFIFAMA